MLRFQEIPQAVLKFLYPASCAACDANIAENSGLCPPCRDTCLRIEVACPKCALPIAGPVPIECASCKGHRHALATCTACFEYGGQLAIALRRLKFHGRNDIAFQLRPLLQDTFSRVRAECDLAIAVPLHRTRLRERGFNQAQRLLQPLAKAGHLRVEKVALRRNRKTVAQSQLSRHLRAANLMNAFTAPPPLVAGKRILLLDDIRTTGATLEAAAKALRRAGAREIHGFVVARTE